MRTHNIFVVAVLLSGILLWSGCASLTGFQTGKTVGDEKGEIAMSVNFVSAPDFDPDDDEEPDGNLVISRIGLFEFGGRYGVAEKIDIGMRINTVLNFLADVKVQVVGDQTSVFAMALGGGVGGFGFVSTDGMLMNFQVPVYFSIHPNDKFALYAAPRYIGQFGTTFERSSGMLNYFGSNFGFEAGKKVKFGLDIAYYNLWNDGEEIDNSLFQIGFGVKFTLGGKE
ncbi:MAG: hypothetical protein HUU34_19355 [Saprospiraceae bacterium]|nr:hypothetical protein [Saprospiraceae bacterium]